jgi:hypothetical protein
MAQSFTHNYTDHSNDTGFQFEFHCDKCGNGYRSSFQTSTLGLASSLLKAAGSFFGGSLASAGWGADHVKDALRGTNWDAAFSAAVTEIRPKFKQCTRCGHWVCPEVCWNESRGLCEDCAPDLQESAAAAQAQAAVEQINERARQTDQTGGLDLSKAQRATCSGCGANLKPKAKFCSECGKPAAAAAFCAECGAEMAPGAKFCAGCGTKTG